MAKPLNEFYELFQSNLINIYLTCNDTASGIFKSQVIDKVETLNQFSNEHWKLVSLIPITHYLKSRKMILNWNSNAIVFPMIPKLSWWRLNFIWLWVLTIVFKVNKVMSRGVFASNLALIAKTKNQIKNTIYDGRGAVFAECEEYKMVNTNFLKTIENLELNAVLKSDFRNSVSQKLILYWQKVYKYASSKHVIIPCTLAQHFINYTDNNSLLNKLKDKLEIKQSDVVFIYAGSVAGWQSMGKLKNWLDHLLLINENCKVVFLSPEDPLIDYLSNKFHNRIVRSFVKAEDVPTWLQLADYGILLRENSVTNQVASPTKFAEYLYSGLDVLISENLGDFSNFVKKYGCGEVVNFTINLEHKFEKQTPAKRENNKILASRYFTIKAAETINAYNKILSLN